MAAIRIKKIAAAGVLSAVVIVLGITGLGFILLPLGAVTILHVPVIIGAILEGPLVGVVIGLLFGVFSIIQAAMIAVTPVDLAFLHYPLIAILPRILIGPGAWIIYALISGRPGSPADRAGLKPRLARESAAVIAAAVAGTLINTVLVLSGLALLVPEVTWMMALTVGLTNGPAEAGIAAAITLSVILTWKRIPRGGKSRLTREAEKSADTGMPE
ncbi:MAG: ECF transporter S component [Spirochaetaceae bacterium]|nr:ECF transporter S component [Spirochaetaceae bacterium]